MGLISRALEREGIATVVVAWNGGITVKVQPARAVITKLPRGTCFGRPNDDAQQLRVLRMALDLLGKDAPLEYLRTDES